jgi:SAM-dependent methyltransferase
MTQADIIKGFTDIDGQPVPDLFYAAMDATALWPAVRQLRAWEWERLDVAPGNDVLDVGCGLGDITIALARAASPGRVVGIDASGGMLAEARRRAGAAGATVEWQPADALELPFPDASFDRCRSERTLQWVADPPAAIAEMLRVLRPGGRLALLDTDWRTLVLDHPDPALARRLGDAVETLRGPACTVGGRLVNLLRDTGVTNLEVTAASHVWTAWDPAAGPAPHGIFPLRLMAEELAAGGLLDAGDATRFVDQIEDAGRKDRFFASITMMAVAARKPAA